MNEQTPATLRVCVLFEDGQYVAQCVDYDFFAVGDSVDAALDEFVRTYMKYFLVAFELGVEPLSDLPAAPTKYQERWRQDTQHGKRGVKMRDIPQFSIVRQDHATPAHPFGRVEASLPLDSAA